jgi:hypothetical protein
VIAEPPFAGATQLIKTLVPEFTIVGVNGTEGTVAGIIAPFPEGDSAELPIALVAIILAPTLDPITRL